MHIHKNVRDNESKIRNVSKPNVIGKWQIILVYLIWAIVLCFLFYAVHSSKFFYATSTWWNEHFQKKILIIHTIATIVCRQLVQDLVRPSSESLECLIKIYYHSKSNVAEKAKNVRISAVAKISRILSQATKKNYSPTNFWYCLSIVSADWLPRTSRGNLQHLSTVFDIINQCARLQCRKGYNAG